MESMKAVNINGLIETFSEPSVPLLNGYVVYMMQVYKNTSINKLSEQLALEQHLADVGDDVGLRKVYNAVKRLKKEVSRLRCTPTRNWNRIVELLTHPFFVQDEIADSGKDIAGPSVSAEGISNDSFITGDDNMVVGSACMEEHNYCVTDGSSADVGVFTATSIDSTYRLRASKCARCVLRNQTILRCKYTISKLRKDAKTVEAVKVKSLRKSLQRKQTQIQCWKRKYFTEKKKNQQMSKQVLAGAETAGKGKLLRIAHIKYAKLQVRFQRTTRHLQQVIRELRAKIDSAKWEMDRLIADNDRLLKEIDALRGERDKISAKNDILQAENLKLIEEFDRVIDENHNDDEEPSCKYGVKVRKIAYKSILKNVPVRNVSGLAEFIAEAVGKDTLKMPHFTSVARMGHEPGVLALIQVGEALHKCESACISFDATTKGNKHINTFSISTAPSGEKLAVSTARVPGGTAIDYASHIISSMKEVASVYSDYTGLPFIETFSLFRDKCTCSVTDRAAVNTCVLEMLQNELDMKLIQLNCNIHPLDAVGSKARECLASLDRKIKLASASGKSVAAAVGVIMNVSMLRYVNFI
jgi:hypothetical protein